MRCWGVFGGGPGALGRPVGKTPEDMGEALKPLLGGARVKSVSRSQHHVVTMSDAEPSHNMFNFASKLAHHVVVVGLVVLL